MKVWGDEEIEAFNFIENVGIIHEIGKLMKKEEPSITVLDDNLSFHGLEPNSTYDVWFKYENHIITDHSITKRRSTMWNWFNGKKTAIGSGFLLGAGIVSRLDITGLEAAINVLEYVGMFFSGGGLMHKASKAKK